MLYLNLLLYVLYSHIFFVVPDVWSDGLLFCLAWSHMVWEAAAVRRSSPPTPSIYLGQQRTKNETLAESLGLPKQVGLTLSPHSIYLGQQRTKNETLAESLGLPTPVGLTLSPFSIYLGQQRTKNETLAEFLGLPKQVGLPISPHSIHLPGSAADQKLNPGRVLGPT